MVRAQHRAFEPGEAALARAGDQVGHQHARDTAPLPVVRGDHREFGALAVGVRAEERFTKDLDFAISVRDQDDAMRVLRHLVDTLRYREPRPFNDNTVDFKGVSLLPPDIESPFPVDILWNACGVEREIVARAERVQFLPGVFVGVATRADLIAMKILALDDARRPRDRGDLAALLRSATAVEVAESRALLRLMEVRGVGFDVLVAQTTENARRLFGLT